MKYILAALSILASPALGQDIPTMVSNPDMCAAIERGEDVQEMGRVLDVNGMYETEYYCEFSTPLDIYWHEERTVVRTGYCSEPGLIQPTMWAFQMSDYEPGVITVWEQGFDEASVFKACWSK